MSPMRRALFFIAFAAFAASSGGSSGKRWWSHVEFLASDRLAGRATGSNEYLQAAHYVAAQFAALHLEPAGTSGFYQTVPFRVKTIDESHSSLAIVRGPETLPLKLGPDAAFSLIGDCAPSTRASAVFAGYGLRVPAAGYDDLAGLDLKGKLVVYLQGAPPSISGPLAAHSQSVGVRWHELRNAGAVGMAVIPNPDSSDIPWARATLSRLMPSMSLDDPALADAASLRVAFRVNPASADKLLEGSGHTFAEILAAARSGSPLPHFNLSGEIDAKLAVIRSSASSPNISAILPGSDPALKNEYVVFSAHLDHLGPGAPINGDSIYNGAMDNAAGVASLLEVAREIASLKTKPKRSILFLAVCGEEEGELGSKYFAAHPPVPAAAIVADVNVDMFLPLYPLNALEVQGLDESTLGADVRALGNAMHIGILADQQPRRNRFIRSDQYSFVRHGVPALAFKFAALPGSEEARIQKEWLTTRYHAPSDDTSQPVDLAAAARFNDFIAALLERVADDAASPAWNPDSFFARFAKGGASPSRLQ
jgi:hypothetical protein